MLQHAPRRVHVRRTLEREVFREWAVAIPAPPCNLAHGVVTWGCDMGVRTWGFEHRNTDESEERVRPVIRLHGYTIRQMAYTLVR
jgi:hypothetical protein